MKRALAAVALSSVLISACQSENIRSASPEAESTDRSSVNLPALVEDYSRVDLPKTATVEFVERLKPLIGMSDAQRSQLIRESYPLMQVSGNETILKFTGGTRPYRPGDVRLITHLKVGEKPSFGFRSIHAALSRDLMDLLLDSGYKRFGQAEAPEGTFVYRKNGLSVMLQYNSHHDMWSLLVHEYDVTEEPAGEQVATPPEAKAESSPKAAPSMAKYRLLTQEDISYAGCKRVGIRVAVANDVATEAVDNALTRIIDEYKVDWQDITVWAYRESNAVDGADGATLADWTKEYSRCR